MDGGAVGEVLLEVQIGLLVEADAFLHAVGQQLSDHRRPLRGGRAAGDVGEVLRPRLRSALPGRILQGEVESFAPRSGSAFTLLPFEPGAGNFTKIVQRVPVRIRLFPGRTEAGLRPGLSTTVRVRVSAP